MSFVLKLRDKLVVIIIISIILPIAFNTVLNVIDFIEVYRESVKERVFVQMRELQLMIEDVTDLGLGLDEIKGLNKECQAIVGSIPYAVYCSVMDNQGKVYFHNVPVKVGYVATDEITKDALEAEGRYFQRSELDSGNMVYAFSVPIRRSASEREGIIQVGVKTDIIDKEVSRQLRRTAVAGLFFTFVAGTIVMLVSKYSIFKSIEDLMQGIKKFGEGNLNSRVQIDSSDEIGELAGVFNSMADKILHHLEERKRAAEKIKKAYNATRDILEKSPFGIYVVDDKGDIEYANPAMIDISGDTYEQFMCINVFNIPTFKQLGIDVKIKKIIEERQPFFMGGVSYTSYYGKKNTIRNFYGIPLEEEGSRKALVFIEDITRLKNTEDALAQEKEQLAVTLRSIGDGVITTDVEGRVVLLNKAAERLSGWSQEEAFAKSFSDIFKIVHEKDRKPCESPVSKVLNTGAAVNVATDTLLITNDGRERIIADSCAPIRDKDSKMIGVVLVFRDITEKRKMEEDFLKMKKLESLGVLAGGIAHDFNNVLTIILSNLTLAKMYTQPDHKSYEILLEAEDASTKAKGLTQQLLTFAKGGVLVKETSSIKELLESTARFIVRGSGVRCEFSLPDDLWPSDIDVGQISQVVQNLIINAEQAMPEGGIIEIKGENIVIDENSSIPLSAGRYVKIMIRDHGVGIPQEYLRKIFDPYFTTKQKGSGLGLAVTYSVMASHHGYIDVESQAGVGTAFYLYLPASDKQLKEKKTVDLADRYFKGKGRVLLMDDEELLRKTLGKVLNSLGYEVDFAEEGNRTVEMYEKVKGSSEAFDVVILDLTVAGGMGGKETIKKLLEIDPEVKAIVSSGYSNDPVMSDFKKFGFRGIVAKPFKIEELSQVLHQVLS